MKIEKIYLDMDGVISDFEQQFINLFKMHPKKFKEKYSEKAFWNLITKKGKKFWSEMPEMKDFKKLISFLNNLTIPVEILSAPSKDPSSIEGKIEWLKKHNINYKQNFVPASEKQTFASPTSLLIDDTLKNVEEFSNNDGLAILYTSYNNFINDLKPYL